MKQQRREMVKSSGDLADLIYEQARRLPPESLLDRAKYVEFILRRTADC